MKAEKQDKNSRLLDTVYLAAGAWPQSMPGPVGYDRVVFYNSCTFIVEYKSSHKAKLTQNEIETRAKIQETGVSYHIAVTPDEALIPLGITFEYFTSNQLWWLSKNLARCNPKNDNYTQAMIDSLGRRLSEMIRKRWEI
jgi:hypothetical protein